MPRYFFQVRDGSGRRDVDGTEKPSLQEAKFEAATLAGNLMRDYAGDFVATGEWRIEVTDEHGLMLFQLDMQLTDSPASRGDPLMKRDPLAPSTRGDRLPGRN